MMMMMETNQVGKFSKIDKKKTPRPHSIMGGLEEKECT